MKDNDKMMILEKAKLFFREKITVNHTANTKKITLKDLKINPFLTAYLANYAFGDKTSQSLAKVLIYPRVLGTSITTSFGQNMQQFCNEVLNSFASLIPGIDIEFIDALDGGKKYCQIKSGPNTINKDDVKTIKDHFKDIRNLGRTNQLQNFNADRDCIVGVLYGTQADLSSHYKNIANSYNVFIGQEFWSRLTGDKDFYHSLVSVFSEVANEIDGSEVLEETINRLAQEIDQSGLF